MQPDNPELRCFAVFIGFFAQFLCALQGKSVWQQITFFARPEWGQKGINRYETFFATNKNSQAL